MTDDADTLREARGQFDAAHAALRRGDRKGALAGALMALAMAPAVPTYRRFALSILENATGYTALPSLVLDALRSCVADPTLDAQSLAQVVKTLLEADARFSALEVTLRGHPDQFEQMIVTGLADWFLGEPLLIGVLSRATNISLRVEDVLCSLRRHVADLASRQQTSALLNHEALLCAMILQLNTSRFAWACSDDEAEKAKRTALPLVQALYTPLDLLPTSTLIALPDVLKAKHNSMLAQRDNAQRLPVMTPITDATSQRVRDQYEHFPYPPWDGLLAIEPTTFAAFVTQRFPGRAVVSTAPHVLSAGCGTGRGANMLGLMLPDASITAIDLSRASLSYALMKAKQLGVRNIRFGVGDILQVASLNQRFDLIESSGVLHHMADPLAGLCVLRSVLNPTGIMRIALYSARGRGGVAAARDVLQAQGIADTDDGVRQARQVLRVLPAHHPARSVVDTPEFFTLDGLHDLVFNVQESRYTPRHLHALLESADLRFLGFDFSDGHTLSTFTHHHPNPADALDLALWEDYEHSHPDTFAEMYQFWCAPR